MQIRVAWESCTSTHPKKARRKGGPEILCEVQGGTTFARACHAGREGVCQRRDGSRHISDAASRGEGAASNPCQPRLNAGSLVQTRLLRKKRHRAASNLKTACRRRSGVHHPPNCHRCGRRLGRASCHRATPRPRLRSSRGGWRFAICFGVFHVKT